MIRARVPRRVAAALVVFAACGLALLPATPASAHSYLVSSDPADGATLTSGPHVLHLRFSESVELAATALDIVDSSGGHHAPLTLRIARGADSAEGGPTVAATEVPSEIVATLPDLAPDSYRVSWRTVSSDDLHSTSGVVVFGVGQTIAASGWHENAPGTLEAALRWLLFLGVAGALGALLLSRLIARAARVESSDRRRATLAATFRIGTGAALLALVADVALLGAQLSASGVSLRRVATGSYGQHWLLRTVGLLVLLLSLAIAGRGRAVTGGWQRATSAAWLGGTAAIVGNALLGHAGASGSLTRVVADAAHVLAVAVWAGTVLTAALVCLATRRRDVVGAALRRFAVPAASCVAVMVVTGIYLASDVVGSVDAAILTWYGRALLLKVVLAALALVFGGINHRRLRRVVSGTPTRHVRVAIIREAAALALVFAAAAVLLSGQPATEPQLINVTADKAVPLLSSLVGDLQESMAIRPNVPGRNVVLVQTLDTRRPSPAPVTGVLVTVGAGGQPVAAEALGDGGWSAPVTLDSDAPVEVSVVVSRLGVGQLRHTYRWIVADTPTAGRRVLVSAAPLRTPLRAAAAGMAVAPVVVILVLLLVRRRRRGASTTPLDETQGLTDTPGTAGAVPVGRSGTAGDSHATVG